MKFIIIFYMLGRFGFASNHDRSSEEIEDQRPLKNENLWNVTMNAIINRTTSKSIITFTTTTKLASRLKNNGATKDVDLSKIFKYKTTVRSARGLQKLIEYGKEALIGETQFCENEVEKCPDNTFKHYFECNRDDGKCQERYTTGFTIIIVISVFVFVVIVSLILCCFICGYSCVSCFGKVANKNHNGGTQQIININDAARAAPAPAPIILNNNNTMAFSSSVQNSQPMMMMDPIYQQQPYPYLQQAPYASHLSSQCATQYYQPYEQTLAPEKYPYGQSPEQLGVPHYQPQQQCLSAPANEAIPAYQAADPSVLGPRMRLRSTRNVQTPTASTLPSYDESYQTKHA